MIKRSPSIQILGLLKHIVFRRFLKISIKNQYLFTLAVIPSLLLSLLVASSYSNYTEQKGKSLNEFFFTPTVYNRKSV